MDIYLQPGSTSISVGSAQVANIIVPQNGAPLQEQWRLPVGGEGNDGNLYDVNSWYIASIHNPHGVRKHPFDGSKSYHQGIDINLDRFERGDVERRLDLDVYAMGDGEVVWVGKWDTTGVIVIRHHVMQADLYVRYAHVKPFDFVQVGGIFQAGQPIAKFDDWKPMGGGDHLHLDMWLQNPKGLYKADSVTNLTGIDPEVIFKILFGKDTWDRLYARWQG